MAKNDNKKAKEDQDSVEIESSETETGDVPSTEGLVKMHKDGQHIHAHPKVMEHHKSNGWKLL